MHRAGLKMKNCIRKFAFATKLGDVRLAENQDQFILLPNLQNESALHYFGVCDGHGPNGQKVSNYLSETIPLILGDMNLSKNPYKALCHMYTLSHNMI